MSKFTQQHHPRVRIDENLRVIQAGTAAKATAGYMHGQKPILDPEALQANKDAIAALADMCPKSKCEAEAVRAQRMQAGSCGIC